MASLSIARRLAMGALAIAALPAGLIAQETRDDEIRLLREQIRQLDQKLRVLERKQELKEDASVEAAKKTAVVTAHASGFALASPDKGFKLNLKALVQVDHRLFLNDKRIPGTTTAISQNTFLLRRIRPIFSGTLGSIYEFAVVPEFAGGDSTASSVALQDAWVSAKLSPTFTIKAGKFTAPVALEPGANRHFIESPFVNTLLPNRDLGVEVIGALGDGYVDYRIGAYNGARNNTAGFARDIDNDKNIAGRVTVNPFKDSDGALRGLGLGVGASVGRDEGAGASTLQAPVTNGQQTLLSFGALVADGRHTRVSPSLFLYTGPASFVAEYAWEKQRLFQGATGFDSKTTAWRASAGYVLTGEDSTNRGVNPKANFKLGESWGAFEVVGRASGIEFDDNLFAVNRGNLPNSATNANATGATAYGAGVNWYLSRNVTLLLNYELTEFDGNTRRPSEQALFSRAQVNF